MGIGDRFKEGLGDFKFRWGERGRLTGQAVERQLSSTGGGLMTSAENAAYHLGNANIEGAIAKGASKTVKTAGIVAAVVAGGALLWSFANSARERGKAAAKASPLGDMSMPMMPPAAPMASAPMYDPNAPMGPADGRGEFEWRDRARGIQNGRAAGRANPRMSVVPEESVTELNAPSSSPSPAL